MSGILYLFPNFLDASNTPDYMQPRISRIAENIIDFVGESEKSVRSFVKKMVPQRAQSELRISLLNEHHDGKGLPDMLKPLRDGLDIGLLSDAGMPCIADPGHQLVKICHQQGFTVVPLSGDSSILLTLVASGFTGQQFTFHGYLPYDKSERIKSIRNMEAEATRKRYTQLFMEAPYRNNALMKDLLEVCDAQTSLCIGSNLTAPGELIITRTIKQWRQQIPDLHKIPVMFALGR